MFERLKAFLSFIPRTLIFIQNHFKAVVFVTIVLALILPSEEDKLKEANLVRLDISGPIMSADEFLNQIEHIEKSPHIKGVLLYVDSPGGAVAPSVEMSMAVKRLKEKLPVVTYAAGTMASGSLYAAAYSPIIIANPGSVVGSIGVIFEGANVEGLMNKLGIKTQVAKMGTFKESGTPFREWNPQERAELERVLGQTYTMFVNDVAKGRKLDPKKANEFADAHIFTAQEALSHGLIDRLGSLHDAQEELKKRAKVSDAVWEEKSKFDKMMERFTQETVTKIFSTMFGLKAL